MGGGKEITKKFISQIGIINYLSNFITILFLTDWNLTVSKKFWQKNKKGMSTRNTAEKMKRCQTLWQDSIDFWGWVMLSLVQFIEPYFLNGWLCVTASVLLLLLLLVLKNSVAVAQNSYQSLSVVQLGLCLKAEVQCPAVRPSPTVPSGRLLVWWQTGLV